MKPTAALILSALASVGAVLLFVCLAGCSHSTVTGNRVEISVRILPITP